MVRAKITIEDSIKYHLIPQVASKNTPKYMFDALTRMYEGKNINQKAELENPTQEYKDAERRNNS
jgi:hypothetical protein